MQEKMMVNTKYTVLHVETLPVEFQKAVEESRTSGLFKSTNVLLQTLLESPIEQ